MAGNAPHIFTRRELTALDKFDQGVPMSTIGKELGVKGFQVMRWLDMLGMYKRVHKQHVYPRRKEAKCVYCEIILERAPEGYDLDLCNWCWDWLLDTDCKQLDERYIDAALVALQEVAA